MPAARGGREKTKKPSLGFDIVADILDGKFYALMADKLPPLNADGNILTVRNHLKTLFTALLKGKASVGRVYLCKR